MTTDTKRPPGRPPIPDSERPPDCGAADDERIAAARRHQRAGEPMCEPCSVAWSAKNRADYLARKALTQGDETGKVEP